MSIFAKRHYEFTAELLGRQVREGFESPKVVAWQARRWAEAFQQDNPRFNEARFMQACSVKAGIPLEASDDN